MVALRGRWNSRPSSTQRICDVPKKDVTGVDLDVTSEHDNLDSAVLEEDG